MFGPFKKRPPASPPPGQFPPVPKWRPHFDQPLDAIVDRVAYYTNRKRDFAVFLHGTCVVLPQPGLADDEAGTIAKGVLDKVYRYHPDMTPRPMDDGNIAIQYIDPAMISVVLTDFAERHKDEIERNHQDALATSEVLITPLGPNTFDDFGKKALWGRCYMFMDAQDPQVIHLVRAAV